MVVPNHANYFVVSWDHSKGNFIGIVISEGLGKTQLLNTWSVLGRSNSNIFPSLEYILLLTCLHNGNEPLVGIAHRERRRLLPKWNLIWLLSTQS